MNLRLLLLLPTLSLIARECDETIATGEAVISSWCTTAESYCNLRFRFYYMKRWLDRLDGQYTHSGNT